MLKYNKTIWKFQLNTGHIEETVLNLPLYSKILHIGYQPKSLNMWVEIDREETETEDRRFYTMHTGSDFDDRRLQFIQTVICLPTYVLHVYEYDQKKASFLTDDDMRL